MDRDDNSQQFLEHEQQQLEERNKLFPMDREIVEFATSHESQLKEKENGRKE